MSHGSHTKATPSHGHAHGAFLMLALGALGVVYGDIGTSVLYAVNEAFFGHHALARTPNNVLGIMSLFFWALVLIISLKYVWFVMRADNHGEGGIFALLTLVRHHRARMSGLGYLAVSGLLLLGASLLYGDGIITPAISVLSAVEGLKVVAPQMERWVVTIAAVILICLFSIQRMGTEKVGKLFGPIMIAWFATIAAMGIPQILQHPQVLAAMNPMYAIRFFTENHWHAVYALGAVTLCFTGGEALYADMGHFGRKPIGVSWLAVAKPALILNYFGQGAMLLSDHAIPSKNIFFSLVPHVLVVPLVLISTAATIIASQALISGCFSLTQQAIALGVFPRLQILHTNDRMKGQIYLPFINWSLLAGCLTLVFMFRSSGALAAAYGIAVTGTMAITSIGYNVVARHHLKLNPWLINPLCVVFLLIDLLFFGANSLKIFAGGYVPILITVVLYSVMTTWQWGRLLVIDCLERLTTMTAGQLAELMAKMAEQEKALAEKLERPLTDGEQVLLGRPVVVTCSRPVRTLQDRIPLFFANFFERWGRLPRFIVLFSAVEQDTPYLTGKRHEIIVHGQPNGQAWRVLSIIINFGYMEQPDMSAEFNKVLKTLADSGDTTFPTDPSQWLIQYGQERMVFESDLVFERLKFAFYELLRRNARPASDYLKLGHDERVTPMTVSIACRRKWVRDSNVEAH